MEETPQTPTCGTGMFVCSEACGVWAVLHWWRSLCRLSEIRTDMKRLIKLKICHTNEINASAMHKELARPGVGNLFGMMCHFSFFWLTTVPIPPQRSNISWTIAIQCNHTEHHCVCERQGQHIKTVQFNQRSILIHTHHSHTEMRV